MSMQNDDELTEGDLDFLKTWENSGKSKTADAEYQPEQEFDAGEEAPEGQADIEVTSEDGDEKSEQAEFDPDAEGDDDGEGEYGERIDESKMDISDLETGDAEGEHADSEAEADGEHEDDEPELSDSDLEDIPDHLEGGDQPEDYEPPENEQELEYDDESESKVEEDDGEGERGNSDEARESDEPIGGSDDEDDLSESDEPEPDLEGETIPEADAESESDELDAQEELEQHIENETPKGDGDIPDDGESGQSDEAQDDDHDQNSEQQGESQEHDESQDTPESEQERPEGNFEGLPEADPKCHNHCEDNAQEPDQDKPECEHCAERIERERELWGVIAQDRNDEDILPGDKLRVVLPMPFTTGGAVLTANVPNLQVDPTRVAESTAGEQNADVCWLSGAAISSFTGWHMLDNGPIWTFKQGKKLRFVEKIGEPMRQLTGSNDLDGDQLDLEEEIDKFKDQLDEGIPEEEQDEQPEDEEAEDEEAEEDNDELEDNEEEDEEDDEDELEEHRQRSRDDLTATQKKRFDNLVERIEKKIRGTFGGTLEYIHVEEVEDHGSYVQASVKVISRGMVFGFGFTARRVNDELDADDLEGSDEAA
jgi:hypothetical protein